MKTSFACLSLGAVVGLLACGDSGTNTGGSNAGGANVAGSNAGGAGAGGAQAGGAPIGGENTGGATAQEICEQAAADILAKSERCDLQGAGGGAEGGGNVGGGVVAECTEQQAATADCVRDCFVAAPCGALDGTDQKAESDYADCIAAC